jgi:hypothetical protein
MLRIRATVLALAAALATVSWSMPSFAQGRTATRLFWQDDASAKLRWGDLRVQAGRWELQPQELAGFPQLDKENQGMVQMQSSDGVVLVGVRDHADGAFGSGWIAVESGVVEEPHGDHSHWKYNVVPRVLRQAIDADQGNPAHVYLYGKQFVLANDRKDGFTLTSASQLRSAKQPSDAAKFHSGGNGHITLAVVDQRVAYATWIAPAGEHQGRVDVVGIGVNAGKGYALRCPTGMLHGATASHGRVFLAPAEGVCWFDADLNVERSADSVTIHHLQIGTSAEDKPLRTGSFSNHGNLVLFCSGKGADARLCWIDAKASAPAISQLLLPQQGDQSLSTPLVVTVRGRKLVCLLRESQSEPETDALLVAELDPNRDGGYADAAIIKELPIGKNQIEDHSGHHEAIPIGDSGFLAISNPAEGSIWVVSLLDMTVPAKFKVQGTPTRLAAVGR